MDSIMLTINESNYHELLFEQPILKNNEYYNVDSLYKESLCFPIYFSFKNNKKKNTHHLIILLNCQDLNLTLNLIRLIV